MDVGSFVELIIEPQGQSLGKLIRSSMITWKSYTGGLESPQLPQGSSPLSSALSPRVGPFIRCGFISSATSSQYGHARSFSNNIKFHSFLSFPNRHFYSDHTTKGVEGVSCPISVVLAAINAWFFFSNAPGQAIWVMKDYHDTVDRTFNFC